MAQRLHSEPDNRPRAAGTTVVDVQDSTPAELDAAVARRAERLDHLWGAEPLYEPQPEDQQVLGLCHDPVSNTGGIPDPLSVCFFTWAGSRVYRAAEEQLELPDLLGPVQASRAYTCGKALSVELNRQWAQLHCSDHLLGAHVTRRTPRHRSSSSSSSTEAADSGGLGILSYIGTVASYANMPREEHGPPVAGARRSWLGCGRRRLNTGRRHLFGGVIWLRPPAAMESTSTPTEAVQQPEGPGVPLTPGQEAFVEATATWRNREALAKLLPDERDVDHLLSASLATYEDISELSLVQPPSAAAAAGGAVWSSDPSGTSEPAPLETPRPMSVMWALLVSLGAHLWRLGYWRVLVDATTLAAPMVLKAYIRYLHQGDEQSHEDNRSSVDGISASNVNASRVSSLFTSLFATTTAKSAAIGSSSSRSTHDDWMQGSLIVILFFFVALMHNVSLQKYTQLCYRCFYTYRSAVSAAILAKALTIEAKAFSLPGFHAGRIVNMLANDVEQLEQLCLLFWPTLVAPLQVGFSMYFLYKLVGAAVFAGFAASVLFAPAQVYLTYKVYRCYADLARATDTRLKATNEFLGGVRAAKFMSWEPVFLAKIQAKRDAEMELIKRSQTLFTMLSFVTDVLPSFVTATLFAVYFFSGHPLNPEVIYPTLSLTTLMCVPFRLLPLYANWMSSFAVAMHRITAFLERADADDQPGSCAQLQPPPSHLERSSQLRKQGAAAAGDAAPRDERSVYAVEFVNATITAFSAEEISSPSHAAQSTPSATSSTTPPSPQQQQQQDNVQVFLRPVKVLSNVSLKIPRGKLTVVIGPTGSGKSSLLQSLLGALEVTQGTVVLRGLDSSSVAYVPEKPWVMDASLQDNILFFDALDRERLHAVLTATQLMADLPTLPDGVATRVGEKGISLSGGQQARLGLARAVYAGGKDLYLMDDPLSALDPSVAQLVVEQCLLDMLKGRTRILATHQTRVAQYADLVVVMADGRIEFAGTYAAYKAYARDGTYKGRRSGFVEYSGAMLPVTQPSSAAELDVLIDGGVSSPGGVNALLRRRGDAGASRSSQYLARPHPREQHEQGKEEINNVGNPFGAVVATAASIAGSGDGIHSDVLSSAAGVLSPTLAAAVAPTSYPYISSSEQQQQQQQQQWQQRRAEEDEGAPGAHHHPCGEVEVAVGDVARSVLSMAGEEERARGPVPMSLYKRYIHACGGHTALFSFLAIFAFSEVLMVSSEVWLSYWSDHPAVTTASSHPASSSSMGRDDSGGDAAGTSSSATRQLSEQARVYLYLGCVLVGALGVPLRFLVSLRFLRRGCRVFHENLLHAVAGATLGFFDAVPHGRLLNRFARDVHLIDVQLVYFVIAFGMSCAYLSSSLLIMISSQFMTIAIVIPFSVIFYKITVFNAAMVRALQRIDNVATTPVVSVLNDFLAGRWVITAFHRSSDMLLEALRRVDAKFSSSYTIVIGQLWVAVRVQLLSATLLSCVAFLGVLSRHVSWVHINVGLISLTMTNASGFTAVLARLMDASSALEASMNSVERVVQYTDNAPQENGGFFQESSTGNSLGMSDGSDGTSSHYRERSVFAPLRRAQGGTDVTRALLGQPTHGWSGGDDESRSSGGGSSGPETDAVAAPLTMSPTQASRTLRARRGTNNNSSATQDRSSSTTVGSGGEPEATTAATRPTHTRYMYAFYDATGEPSVVGSIEMQHVYLRYRPGLPFVLQDLSFAVKPGERIGVVGRTGSGKSSLMLVLMRLIDLTAGSLRVNGRDISTYRSVRQLRRLFAVIPQDPVLFDGSIRSNLDPLHEYTDEEVCTALKHVGMAEDAVRSTKEAPRLTLEATVAEGGRNFSVGQRQLLCLARALLRRDSCFLLMDEATASVDGAMDQVIQDVVQQQFPHHTIFSIAHRLHTVARYDRILMLDNGRLACIGTPEELMEGTVEADGAVGLSPFAQMVASMGPDAVRLFTAQMKKPTRS